VGSGSNSGAWTVRPSHAQLTALPFMWGMVVAFAVVVLVAALVAVELRRLWTAAKIGAFMPPTKPA
jgi:hypothetical protein